jgi:hypothetical protein
MHPVAHGGERLERGEDVTVQATAASAAQSNQHGSATAQPNPSTPSPLPSRPPGAAGPGRAVSGWWGPGLPGPGRPSRPRR